MGFTRNIAEEDIRYFTHRNDVAVVSPFLTGPDILSNVKSTRARLMEEEQVSIPYIYIYRLIQL